MGAQYFLSNNWATIFDFNGSSRLGRERNICTKGVSDGQKLVEGWGGGV